MDDIEKAIRYCQHEAQMMQETIKLNKNCGHPENLNNVSLYQERLNYYKTALAALKTMEWILSKQYPVGEVYYEIQAKFHDFNKE